VYNLVGLSENDKSIVLGDDYDEKNRTRTVIINNDNRDGATMYLSKMKDGYLANEGLKLDEGVQIYRAYIHNFLHFNGVNTSDLTIDQNRLATGFLSLPGGWVNF